MRTITWGHGLGAGWMCVGLCVSGCGELEMDMRLRRGVEPVPGPEPAGPPTDTRPVITAAKSPVPVSGGTLMITAGGTTAVAADPDRDRVSIVSLDSHTLVHTVPLRPGDEPGRVVEGAPGKAHVSLRRGGAVVTLDIATGTVTARHDVCGAPRGLAYETSTDTLHVACAGGELVTLSASSGEVIRSLDLGPDLRDVVIREEGLLVTRFRSGALIRLDPSGNVLGTTQGSSVIRVGLKPRPTEPTGAGGSPAEPGTSGEPVPTEEEMDPAVVWRPVPSPDGKVHIIHQYELDEPIRIGTPHDPTVPEALPYGSGVGSCGGLVQAGVSQLLPGGTLAMGRPLSAPPLTVDGAVSPDGQWLALAHAGSADPENPSNPTFGAPSAFGAGTGSVSVMSTTENALAQAGANDCSFTTPLLVPGQATAVAFNPGTAQAAVDTQVWLAVQTREPARLAVFRDMMTEPQWVELGGESALDTGHEIFHRDAGSGIACASCHTEGSDDGRVWRFEPIGQRRTQALNVGLEGTAPFHWDGDMKDLEMLMSEVFVGRMGGPMETPERVAAVARWVGALTPPAALVAADDADALAGKALFESRELGCSTCHSGAKLTNNESYHVGTTAPGHTLQVPSLVGVGHRAPFLHDGRAATLEDRFEPSLGGGDLHGRTSQLSAGETGLIVRYLESL